MEHMMIFAGTTEGREIASIINERSYPAVLTVCTATEYGRACVMNHMDSEQVELMAGRMDKAEMATLMKCRKTAVVIDATHPFARDATKNIKSAAEDANAQYFRLLRNRSDQSDEVVWAESVKEAAEYLIQTEGRILIATGSKELDLYTLIPEYEERCYVRVLSTEEAVMKSIRLGFEGQHLYAMQGPFSKEMNLAILHQTGAAYFVTKESGTEGGYREKLEAALETGARLVVIRRPEETGNSLEEILSCLERRYEC